MISTNSVRNLLETPLGVGDGLIRDLCDEIDRLRAGKPRPQGKTFIVALQLLEGTNNGEKSSIVLEAHNTGTVEEAMGAALLRHAGGRCSLGAYKVACIDILTADLPIPEEITVEAEVHTATPDENAASSGRG